MQHPGPRRQELAVRRLQDHRGRHIALQLEVRHHARARLRHHHRLGRFQPRVHRQVLRVDRQAIGLIGNQVRHQQVARAVGLAQLAVLVQHVHVRRARRHQREAVVDPARRRDHAAHQHQRSRGLGRRLRASAQVLRQTGQLAVAAQVLRLALRVGLPAAASALHRPARAAFIVHRTLRAHAVAVLALLAADRREGLGPIAHHQRQAQVHAVRVGLVEVVERTQVHGHAAVQVDGIGRRAQLGGRRVRLAIADVAQGHALRPGDGKRHGRAIRLADHRCVLARAQVAVVAERPGGQQVQAELRPHVLVAQAGLAARVTARAAGQRSADHARLAQPDQRARSQVVDAGRARHALPASARHPGHSGPMR